MKYFNIPTKICNENGLYQLKEIIQEHDAKRIFLVTGKNSFEKSGFLDVTKNLLDGRDVFVYNNVEGSPTLEGVQDALEKLIEYDSDMVIGAGGGAVMDIGKIISCVYRNDTSILGFNGDFTQGKIKEKQVPFVAIPTTAGTGSEVTPFSVFYKDKRKQSFGGPEKYIVSPDYAILDSELTLSLPGKITAATGLDALTQLFEAYFNKNSNSLTDNFIPTNIAEVFGYLEKTYKYPNEVKFRERMMYASLWSGIAISRTTTGPAHSLSYPMTAHFDLEHGFACALTLPEILKFNYDRSDLVRKKLNGLVEYIFPSINKNHFEILYDSIQSLKSQIGAPLTLKDAKIDDKSIITKEGFTPERMFNSIEVPTEEDVNVILSTIEM